MIVKTAIGDICSISSAGDKPSTFEDVKTEKCRIPVIANGVDNDGVIGYTDKPKITTEAVTVSARGNVGTSFYRNEPYYPVIRLLTITPKNWNEVNCKYLYYLLKNSPLQGIGSVQAQLTVPDVSNMEVFFESDYVKQTYIADFLSTVDSKITNNTAICSDLEAMTKLLYDYWFVQFDFPDENGKPYKSSGGKMVWNDEFKMDVPEGWDVVPFGECISSINTGLNPRNNFKLNTGGVIKYLTVKNLTTKGAIDFSSCDLIDETARAIIHKRSDISVGDILFASISPLGRCSIITHTPDDWDINESVFSIRPNYKNMTTAYLYMTFMSERFVKQAEGSSAGSVFKGIRVAELQDLKTILPPKSVLDMFDEKVKAMVSLKANAFFENQQLESLRDFLLPMLMNGQVKVGE